MVTVEAGDGATILCGDSVGPGVPACDLLLVDAPYSARTHSAYRDMEDVRRSPIRYECWSEADVRAAVAIWEPLTRGWFVTVTDHVLAPAWEAALEETGRYVFSPLACVEPGRSVRVVGDGPANWTCWAIVARPRSRAFATWGALRGAYVVPAGLGRERNAYGVTGGKPDWLGEALVADYSRPGDVVLDPCCGAGTFPAAAKRLGRTAIGIDISAGHADIAAKRCAAAKVQERLAFDAPEMKPQKGGLFG